LRGGGFVPLNSKDPARSLIHAQMSFARACEVSALSPFPRNEE
jgi:hypothetical protein